MLLFEKIGAKVSGKPIFIFDFDDTLAISSTSVGVIRGDGTKIKLNSREFAGFNFKPDDQLDFTEFDKYPQNARLIDNTVQTMQELISSHGPRRVMILTARRLVAPVKQFLRDQGISPLPHMVGTAGSAGKSEWLMAYLEAFQPSAVHVWEDCQDNIASLGATVDEYNSYGTRRGAEVSYHPTCVVAESVVRHRVRKLLVDLT